MKFSRIALAFVATLGCLSIAYADPLTAGAMWELKRLGDPALSPDGRWAVVPLTSYDIEENKSTSDLWLVPTKSGKARQLTSGNANDSDPVWSPNGRLIAFISRRGDDKEGQIYVIPFDGGEARRVTEVPTGASAPKWFPDSRRIAFLSQVWPETKSWEEVRKRKQAEEDRKMTARVWDKAPFSYWDHYLDKRQTHVYAVSIEGGEPKALTLATGLQLDRAAPDRSSYDISPDGAELAFVADVDRTGIDPNFDVFVMPIEGGTPKNITADNPANDAAPLYSPDGRNLAFLRQKLKHFYADRSRLALYDRREGNVRELTESWDRSVGGLVWTPDSDALFGAIDDAGSMRVYRFDVSGGEPQAVTTGASVTSLAIAGSGPVIVGLRQSFTEPPTLVSIIPRNGKATKLSSFNDEALAKIDFGRVESVTYKGANGRDIQMWVNYPPGFTPDRKWPVYLLLHGGPHNAIVDGFHWRWNAQVFAGWGYVTAWHNFHGSSGFGQAFTDSMSKEWAELPYQDTIAAANWFTSQPWVDGERMAAGGGSFGGYLATVLLGRDHPFKTLIAHAAVYNLYTQYASDDGAIPQRFGDFWEDRERFERNSPHVNAASFKTPTLIIHGQQDLRVPVNHGLELFNTLQSRGVPSKLVYYPDENHWILKSQNSIFWYDTKKDWLQRYVKPGPGEAVVTQETVPSS